MEQLDAIAIGLADERRGVAIPDGIGERTACRMNAVWDHQHTIGFDDSGRDQLLARCISAAQDALRGEHSFQQSSPQRSLHERSSVRTREHTPEGVDVVATDHRAAGRQLPRQVRVAVIHDVKEIVVADLRRQPPRVVPDAVENSVSRIRCCRGAQQGEPGQARSQARPQFRGIDGSRFRRAQVEQQHLRDEIHRVPALFSKIGQDSDPRTPHRLPLTRSDVISCG